MITRDEAARRDGTDPLAPFRDEFAIGDERRIYLDGNSLGRLPRATAARLRSVVETEWGEGLVESWSHWIDLPAAAGAAIAPLVGAAPEEVLVTDQTSVNLYKLASAALRARPDRPDIVSDEANFPSDLYVLAEVARQAGGRLRTVAADADPGPALDRSVGLLSLSHVSFRSGRLRDLAGLTARAHAAGAMVLWDLSHSVGAVPVDLAGCGADLAVGCTYKYLNGGPGSPAFLFVRADLHDRLDQPIPGWFGHDRMFDFAATYRPAPGIRRFAVGTPPIIQTAAVAEGAALVARAGIDRIRAKSLAQTGLLIELCETRLGASGFGIGTPRDPDRRGSHVALRHPDAAGVADRLLGAGVVVDVRPPDVIRCAVAPLYTRFVDVFDVVDRLVEIMADRT